MTTDTNHQNDVVSVNERYAPEKSNLRNEYERPAHGCGCVPIWLASIIGGVVVILAVLGLGYVFASDTRDQLIGSVEDGFNICLLDCGDDVLEIDEGPILLTLENTNWHEGTRANRNYPQMEASKDWPVSWLTGSRSLKYNATVTVTAGVDFELVEDWENAVMFEGDELTISIPPPQIRDCILLEEQSTFYDYSCKALGVISSCSDLEDALRIQALKSSADDDYETVLNDAFDNVEDFLEELILGVNPDIRRVHVVMNAELEVEALSAEGTCIDYTSNTQSIWDVIQESGS